MKKTTQHQRIVVQLKKQKDLAATTLEALLDQCTFFACVCICDTNIPYFDQCEQNNNFQ